MTMADENRLQPPDSTAGDVGHAIVKAGLSSIPFAIPTAAVLFSLVIGMLGDQFVRSVEKPIGQPTAHEVNLLDLFE